MPRLLILICLVALLSNPAIATAESTATLPITYDKLVNKKKLTIAYLGASVMAGAGATVPEKSSWRALVTQALQAKYPDARIEAVNTSVGGKGADYANFHFRYDTLPKNPDLILTDAYCNGPGGDDLIRCNEGLVRQIRKALPEAEIIFIHIYTKSGGMDGYYRKSELPPSMRDLHALAQHYDLVDIDLAKLMYDEFQKQPGAKLLTDVVHPSDAGHKLYADAIIGLLTQRIVRGATTTPAMPAPLKPHPMEDPAILDPEAAMKRGSGWKVLNKPMGFIPATLTPADLAKGAELKISFTGTQVGIYWLQSFDGGQVEWSVDDQPMQKLSSSNDFLVKRHTMVMSFDRCRLSIPYGPHKLKLRALPEKPAGSLGNVIKIGAIVAQ